MIKAEVDIEKLLKAIHPGPPVCHCVNPDTPEEEQYCTCSNYDDAMQAGFWKGEKAAYEAVRSMLNDQG